MVVSPVPATTADAINKLLPTMQPGEWIVYHTGSLMYDRHRSRGLLAMLTVHGAAKAAWAAYERGEVTLVQRKLGPLKYEYIAIKRQPEVKKTKPTRTDRNAKPKVTAPVTEIDNDLETKPVPSVRREPPAAGLALV